MPTGIFTIDKRKFKLEKNGRARESAAIIDLSINQRDPSEPDRTSEESNPVGPLERMLFQSAVDRDVVLGMLGEILKKKEEPCVVM